jgi:hypothetical protein
MDSLCTYPDEKYCGKFGALNCCKQEKSSAHVSRQVTAQVFEVSFPPLSNGILAIALETV